MRPPSVVLVNPTDGETQVLADQSINVYLSQPWILRRLVKNR